MLTLLKATSFMNDKAAVNKRLVEYITQDNSISDVCFEISDFVQCVRFFVIHCEIYKQFLGKNGLWLFKSKSVLCIL